MKRQCFRRTHLKFSKKSWIKMKIHSLPGYLWPPENTAGRLRRCEQEGEQHAAPGGFARGCKGKDRMCGTSGSRKTPRWSPRKYTTSKERFIHVWWYSWRWEKGSILRWGRHGRTHFWWHYTCQRRGQSEAVLRVEEEDNSKQNFTKWEMECDVGLSMLTDSQDNQYILTKPRDAEPPLHRTSYRPLLPQECRLYLQLAAHNHCTICGTRGNSRPKQD